MKNNACLKLVALIAGLAAFLNTAAQSAIQYFDTAAHATPTWDNGISFQWGNLPGGPYSSAWASGNDAVFEGTASLVTIGSGGVTVHSLFFTNVSGYLITNSAGSALTLVASTPTITTWPGLTATVSVPISGTAGLTVEGGGTLNNLAGPHFNNGLVDVGFTTGTNTFLISNGAAFNASAARSLRIGGQASGGGRNTVTISTPGNSTTPSFRVHGNSQQINVGVDSSDNTLIFANGSYTLISGVTGGASTWTLGQNSGNNNSMVVADTNTVVTRSGGTGSFIAVGTTGTNNSLIVTNGGYLRPRRLSAGSGAGGRNNYIKVTGVGTFLDGTDSQSIIEIGRGGSGSTNNYMLIENGAAAGFDNGNNGNRGNLIGPVNGADYNYIRVDGVGSVLTNRNIMPLGIGGISGQNNNSHVITDSTAFGNHFDIYDGALAIQNTIYLLGVNSSVNLGNGANVSQLQVQHSTGGTPANTFYGAGVRLTKGDARLNINRGRLIAGTVNGADTNLVSGSGKVDLLGSAWILTDDVTFVRAVASEITGSGSLTKEGIGTLLHTVSNSYSGLTTISNGVLQAAVTNSLGTGDLNIITGAKLEVPAGVMVSAAALQYDGVVQSPGTYGATGSGAAVINDTYFAGTGILNVLGGTVLPLRITSTTYDAINDQLTLKWDSSPGATYTIENTQEFVGDGAGTGWDNLTTGIASGGITTTRVIDAPAPGTFYRIRKE